MVWKNRFFFVFLFFGLGFGKLSVAWATPNDPCEGFQNKINVRFEGDIERAFNNLNNPAYLNPSGDTTLLCFEHPRDRMPVTRPLTLRNNTGRSVVVSGLNIFYGGPQNNPDFTLLSMIGTSPIKLFGSNFWYSPSCIISQGNSFALENISLEGCGMGVKMIGEDDSILSSVIRDSSIGIQIGDQNHVGNNIHIGPENSSEFETKRVRFLNNVTHIKGFNGNGDFFKHNEYGMAYELGSHPEAGIIDLPPGMNGNAKKPVVLAVTGEEMTDRPLPALTYPDGVHDLPIDGSSIIAYIRVKSPYRRGNLEILTYGTKSEIRNWAGVMIGGFRGYSFFQDAPLISSVPDGQGKYLLTFQLTINNQIRPDGTCKYGTALFHRSVYGSGTFSEKFYINPPLRADADIRTVCSGGSPVGLISTPSIMEDNAAPGNQAPAAIPAPDVSTPANPTPAVEEPARNQKSEKEKESLGATTPSGSATSQSNLGSTIPTASAPTGIRAGGCSLAAQHPNPAVTDWMLIIGIPSILFSLHQRRAKVAYGGPKSPCSSSVNMSVN